MVSYCDAMRLYDAGVVSFVLSLREELMDRFSGEADRDIDRLYFVGCKVSTKPGLVGFPVYFGYYICSDGMCFMVRRNDSERKAKEPGSNVELMVTRWIVVHSSI